jgi:hypothetical protein
MPTITTSQGRDIPHCHLPNSPCRSRDVTAAQIADASAWLANHFPNVVEISPATYRFNCHGFAYAQAHGGWFNSSRLFNEDDYSQVPFNTPQPGDIVSYINHRGRIAHSAVVDRVSNGQITRLRSKWGAMPEVFHQLNDVPASYGNPQVLRRQNGNLPN